MRDLRGNVSQMNLHSSSDTPLLLEHIGTETKRDNIRADKTLGCLPCSQQKNWRNYRAQISLRRIAAISALEIPTRSCRSSFHIGERHREMGSRHEGFIRLLLKGRFSTLRPVKQPSLPGPAPCPLSPHICKSLKLSGLDHTDRAGLCQTSNSLPGLDLNGLGTLSRSTRGGRSSVPLTNSPGPISSSELCSAQQPRRGAALHPTEGAFFEGTGE